MIRIVCRSGDTLNKIPHQAGDKWRETEKPPLHLRIDAHSVITERSRGPGRGILTIAQDARLGFQLNDLTKQTVVLPVC